MKVQSLSIRIENSNESDVIQEMLDHTRKTKGKISGKIIDDVLRIRIDELQEMVWACQNGFGKYSQPNIETPSWVSENWTNPRNVAMMNEFIHKMATSDVFIMDRE